MGNRAEGAQSHQVVPSAAHPYSSFRKTQPTYPCSPLPSAARVPKPPPHSQNPNTINFQCTHQATRGAGGEGPQLQDREEWRA